ncbi:MAG: DNA alkylation response protein [Oceanospirillaceae bacterium]|uniref:acyl-CoA dehydrogenase family protein n=2 Tax=unclassified Thalassolituus TaxID=2624967 RepID=UPI000C5FB8CB|nr:acyl-CoA dehydrogenase family protein [Thalassolituus sp. UBA6592]MAY01073.1 DNA alkylation response protein [Oceanospirillaceae bacterium]MBL36569.1 DNA alkylation response protein [Oceanospirillaceae bacterium]MBS53363.1 DNA alkylation response protein [Oceanospirillaceae bacterium]|tara:strand:+ start:6142 stop:7848 length:1707 start_codon:yes stop_codon:yes gene_type:complete
MNKHTEFTALDYQQFDCQQHKTQAETHPVFNQPTALENFNTYLSDTALQYWVKAYSGDWAEEQLIAYGERCGGDLIEAGFQANENKPEFYPHDRFGKRIDLAKFHPAYHELMRTAIEADMHSLPWKSDKKGAHVARAGMVYQHMNADAGSGCPLTMTFAAVPALQHAPEVAKEWLPKIMAPVYDERNVPYFDKKGVTIGMAMTEKQGGSDVRANTTRAYPLNEKTGNGGEYEIVGHKWFCSAPMCDAFLMLAHTEKGLSCFLLPRWRPDGSKNQMYVQRLKNKLGNVSNASSEVEYRGAFAWMVGEEGKGVRTIIEMVSMTRFDCMIGSSALMRGALAQAMHHTSGRAAFGKNLHQQPLMQNVLADLAIESEAALAITMRVGHALDNLNDEQENLFARLATAVGKYWICKRAPHFAYEAMECIGGVGYVEDNILPRIYREAPVNAIWEGSGNVQCLDVLRAMSKEPKVVDAFFNELKKGCGKYPQYDQFLQDLQGEFSDISTLEYRSRTVVDKLAVGLQASVLIQHGDALIADAFIRSRIARNGAFNYGTLESGIDCEAIMARALPKV